MRGGELWRPELLRLAENHALLAAYGRCLRERSHDGPEDLLDRLFPEGESMSRQIHTE